MRLVSPSPHHAGLQSAMTMIKLLFASHPPIAERVNAKHYAEVDPEAPMPGPTSIAAIR
jgi:Zn-dependent protease with chaperone function